MSYISKIIHNTGPNKDKVHVYIDNIFCTSIRERTWIAMNLAEGSEIECEELKKLENNFWKKLYGISAWEKEKHRINRATLWFKQHIPEVTALVVGFGADTTEIIEDIHSQEKGEPDLEIKFSGKNLIYLEVSGTEKKRGKDFWIRKDKVDYIQKNIQDDIWILLHYKLPKEQFIWVRIDKAKEYRTDKINVKGAIEYYIVLDTGAPEIVSSQEFKNYIEDKIAKI